MDLETWLPAAITVVGTLAGVYLGFRQSVLLSKRENAAKLEQEASNLQRTSILTYMEAVRDIDQSIIDSMQTNLYPGLSGIKLVDAVSRIFRNKRWALNQVQAELDKLDLALLDSELSALSMKMRDCIGSEVSLLHRASNDAIDDFAKAKTWTHADKASIRLISPVFDTRFGDAYDVFRLRARDRLRPSGYSEPPPSGLFTNHNVANSKRLD